MFKKKKPYLEFRMVHKTYDADAIPHPVRANKAVPNWYKKLKPDNPRSKLEVGTAKRCVPFLDAVTQGFIIPLWADLVIQAGYPIFLYNEEKERRMTLWINENIENLVGKRLSDVVKLDDNTLDFTIYHASRSSERIIRCEIMGDEVDGHSEEQIAGSPTLKLPFGRTISKLANPWSIKTQKDWSIQIKNPSNSFETGLVFFEGVVDTDEYNLPINFPFIWNGDDGEHIIPQGTPILQVIPFERKKVDIHVTVGSIDDIDLQKQNKSMAGVLKDRYKRLFWHNRKKP